MLGKRDINMPDGSIMRKHYFGIVTNDEESLPFVEVVNRDNIPVVLESIGIMIQAPQVILPLKPRLIH